MFSKIDSRTLLCFRQPSVILQPNLSLCCIHHPRQVPYLHESSHMHQGTHVSAQHARGKFSRRLVHETIGLGHEIHESICLHMRISDTTYGTRGPSMLSRSQCPCSYPMCMQQLACQLLCPINVIFAFCSDQSVAKTAADFSAGMLQSNEMMTTHALIKGVKAAWLLRQVGSFKQMQTLKDLKLVILRPVVIQQIMGL